MKRERVMGVLICLSFFALFATSAPALDRIRIGLSSSSVSPNHGAIYNAEIRGIFKKYGIDIEVIEMGGGAARGVSALIARDIQFMSGGGATVISAALRGADLVMVASVLNKGIQRVVSRPEVKVPGNLKGKRVGITRFGSASHTVLQMMLRRWEISPADI